MHRVHSRGSLETSSTSGGVAPESGVGPGVVRAIVRVLVDVTCCADHADAGAIEVIPGAGVPHLSSAFPRLKSCRRQMGAWPRWVCDNPSTAETGPLCLEVVEGVTYHTTVDGRGVSPRSTTPSSARATGVAHPSCDGRTSTAALPQYDARTHDAVHGTRVGARPRSHRHCRPSIMMKNDACPCTAVVAAGMVAPSRCLPRHCSRCCRHGRSFTVPAQALQPLLHPGARPTHPCRSFR